MSAWNENSFPSKLKHIILLYFQLIVSGQAGKQVNHVLKVVVVDPKNLQDIKLYLKVRVDLVLVQVKKLIVVIPTSAQVSKILALYQGIWKISLYIILHFS